MTQSLLDRAKNYIDQNGGTRVLVGLGALSAIALFHLVGLVGEQVESHAIEVAALKAEVVGMQSLGSVEEMERRLEDYRKALSTYESRVIEAETAGLISAEIQSLMRASAEKATLEKVQIEVNVNDELSTEELIAFVVEVRAVEKIDGTFAGFIAEVISGKSAFYVSTVNWDRRSGRVNIEFECVGRIKEPTT